MAYAKTYAKRKGFSVTAEMHSSIRSLVDLSVNLHQAVYDQDQAKIDLIVSKMKRHIQHIKNKNNNSRSYHEKSYLNKLFGSLQFNLIALNQSSRYRTNYVHVINRKLAHIAHIYGLKKYFVFFCAKDKNVWMQATKSKPLHLNYEVCGQPVGK